MAEVSEDFPKPTHLKWTLNDRYEFKKVKAVELPVKEAT